MKNQDNFDRVIIINCRSSDLRYFPMYEAFLASDIHQKSGKDVKIINVFNWEKPDFLLDKIGNRDLVVFWEYFTTKAKPYLYKYFEVAKFLKEKTDNPLCFGGFWSTTHSRHFKEFDLFDHLFEGYSIDKASNEIINYSSETSRYVDIRGIVDWNKYDLDFRFLHNKYAYFSNSTFWGYLTSISCTRNCTFCWVNSARNDGTEFSARSVERVCRDFDLIVENYPEIKKVIIKDLYFFAKEKRAFEILEYVKSIGLETSINLDVTIFNIREEFLENLKNIGIVSDLFFGLESFNEETRKRVAKPFTKERLDEGFEAVDKFGISLTGNVILGLPWQDETEIDDAIENALLYMRKYKHAYVSMNIFKPEYGTDLQKEFYDDLHDKLSFDEVIDLYNNLATKFQDQLYGDKFNFINLEKVHHCIRLVMGAKRAKNRTDNFFKKMLFEYVWSRFEKQLTKPYFQSRIVSLALKQKRVNILLRIFLLISHKFNFVLFGKAAAVAQDYFRTRKLTLHLPKTSRKQPQSV